MAVEAEVVVEVEVVMDLDQVIVSQTQFLIANP
jgi:hypothetical protein